MKSFVVILCCLSAVFGNPGEVLEYFNNGQRTCRFNCRQINPLVSCPPSNCPPPSRDPNCGPPNCNIEANRAFHHPHQDPNFYYTCQMADGSGNNWMWVEMPCACGTLFWSPANRCVHPHEWSPETFCISSQPNEPVLRPCPEDDNCPTCNGPPGIEGPPVTPPPVFPPPVTPPPVFPPPVTPPPVLPPPVTPPPIEGPPVTPPPPNGCPCMCIPCVWWPCQPCATNCPCNQQPQQPPQNPWNPPQQNPWNPPNHPINPWDRPVQQNPWDRPVQNW